MVIRFLFEYNLKNIWNEFLQVPFCKNGDEVTGMASVINAATDKVTINCDQVIKTIYFSCLLLSSWNII